MSKPRMAYTPHPNATSETELSVLAAIYAFALQKYQAKQRSVEHVRTSDDRDASMRILKQSKEATMS